MPAREQSVRCFARRASARVVPLHRHVLKDRDEGEDAMSSGDGNGERIVLSVKTSWLSEYRNRAGMLVMFDVSGHLTSFGLLCAMMAQVPGVEFASARPPARFTGPARLRFRGQDHGVT